ncbi:DUF4184 family protein [Streptomyces silvisoli]|uniref:DUF4184 family protein n=1 Tax=Streptomyces silvisoli TaxID=3034235 RepID=A0ABT5ZFS3_9ACTN|nr:DUF4184 family protein [Streptomyces silvisoli]MDF3288675.1 DUF4184 family protein [Streptomyces silvisoli]
MPFTFSHPAAVLPLLRTDASGTVRGRGPLLAAGLIAGSLAPDVPFFLDSLIPGTGRYGRATHGLAGAAVLDPLLAAGLTGGWLAVRGPLTALLPPRIGGRAAPLLGMATGGATAPTVRDTGWFWVSAATGAATHLGWDAFTHQGRGGVRLLPVLSRTMCGVPLYHWAQYASSAAGLAALGLWTARESRRAPHVPPPAVPRLTARSRRAGGWALAACAVAGAALRCRRDRPGDVSSLIASATFGAGAGLAPAAAAVAAAVHARRARSRDRSGQCAADSQSGP